MNFGWGGKFLKFYILASLTPLAWLLFIVFIGFCSMASQASVGIHHRVERYGITSPQLNPAHEGCTLTMPWTLRLPGSPPSLGQFIM